MFKLLEDLVFVLYAMASALIFLVCILASLGAAIVAVLLAQRTSTKCEHGLRNSQQSGQSTGRLEHSEELHGSGST